MERVLHLEDATLGEIELEVQPDGSVDIETMNIEGVGTTFNASPEHVDRIIAFLRQTPRATVFRDGTGQPYTDEELGRGDSPRRNRIISDQMEKDWRHAKEAGVIEVEGKPQDG